MEWDDDDNEPNENAETVSNATEKSETSEVNHRKSFIPHKKRVILQELEPISENNILEDCSDYLSRSINFSLRQRKYLNQKKMNPQCSYRSTDSAENEAAQPETPPATLRQRIIEAQEMREYLEKELNELKDFTTSEKQMLAAEKGIEELKIQNSLLEDQNNQLQLKMDDMQKLAESQKTLLNSLNSSFDEVKNKLESSNVEKDMISKELDEIKRRYVDEQTEKQMLETKWKHREDDLKKSLEESWRLLRIKEERITKMNEKISCLYSEREKVKDLNFTFGGQLLPSAEDYDVKTIEQNISELFELSSHNALDQGRTLNYSYEIDCKGDNVQNNGLANVNLLHEELVKYKHSLEMHKKQIEDLNKNLADKDLTISTYESNLSEIESYLSGCLSNHLICMDKDNQTHKTSFEKIKHEINIFLSLMEKDNTFSKKISEGDKCNVNLEPNECGDIGFKTHEINLDVETENKKIMICQHSQTDVDYATMISNEEQLILFKNKIQEYEQTKEKNEIKQEKEIIDGTMKECLKENEERDVVRKTNNKYEDEIKNNDCKEKITSNEEDEIKVLQNKELCYEEKVKSYQEEINICLAKLSAYEEKIQCNKDEIKMLLSSISTLKENTKNKNEEINLLLSKISDYEDKVANNEEEINALKNNVLSYEEKIKQKEEEFTNLRKSILGLEETIQRNIEETNTLHKKVSAYEEEIIALQGKISMYKDQIKNREEEMKVLESNVVILEETIKSGKGEIIALQNKVLAYEEQINGNDEINILLNEISGYKEKIQCNVDEINTLQSKIFTLEAKIKTKDEELNLLLSKVSGYEDKFANNEEEIGILKNNVSSYEEKIKQKDETLQILEKNVVDLEETIKIKEKEIIVLQNEVSVQNDKIRNSDEDMNLMLSKVSDYEGKLTNNEEELKTLKDSVSINQEKLKEKDEERSILEKRVDSLEETIKRKEEEMTTLQNEVSVFSNKIRNSDEEINLLLCKVSDYDAKLTNNEKELNKVLESNDKIDILSCKISEYEEKIQCYEDEINMLQGSISTLNEKIKNEGEEINLLLSKISGYEDKVANYEEQMNQKDEELSILGKIVIDLEGVIKSKYDEITTLQNEVSVHSNKIKSIDEEMNLLLSKVSDYEAKLRNNEEEMNTLKDYIFCCEEKIKRKEEELNQLGTSIVGLEEIIKSKEEVISVLRNEVSDSNDKMKNSQEEMDLLLSKIPGYELKLMNNEEKINALKNNLSCYEEKNKQKDEEINILGKSVVDLEQAIKSNLDEINTLNAKVCVYEAKITNNEEEINALKDYISCCEEKIKQKEEEISRLGISIVGLEETIKINLEEINILQTKESVYKVKLANDEDEINALKSDVSDCEGKINQKEEEITMLENSVVALEKTIKCKIEEINFLNIKVSDYEEEITTLQNEVSVHIEKRKNIEEEKNVLENNLEVLQETIKIGEEKTIILQNKVLGYEEQIKNKEDEINLLKTKVSDSKEKMKIDAEETDLTRIGIDELEISSLERNTIEYERKMEGFKEVINILKNKVSCYEKTIKSNAVEINLLKNNISKDEQTTSGRLPLDIVPANIKNVGNDGLNHTNCSTISDNTSVSYSHNDLADVEYDVQPPADSTLNFTTLDSSSQLEQSMFISKLPQTDSSIKEYDPLASVSELSYNEELETTLTEQLIKPFSFENLNVLYDSNLINSIHGNHNVNENIEVLIQLLNNGGDMSNANFDDIFKQLSTVKEMLKPKEDSFIYSFCQIIENFLSKELVNKKIWNQKMLLVKETMTNLKNIKDSFLKLKNTFTSLENVTSQDHETINSRLKNLFLCIRELSSENVLLKEQLKVSLLSEEKFSKINDLLRSDLTNTLQAEKDLKVITDYNKTLEDRLKEKCKEDDGIIFFIDKISNLLNPNVSWPADNIIKKLEKMYSLLMESLCQGYHEDLHELGFLNFFRNLFAQNSVLKHNIDPNIKIIKNDIISLNVDITQQFNNLNADFYSISCKLSELNGKQEQESKAYNILKDNLKNLVLENKGLKEELHNLTILNNDLSSTSKDYDLLMDKYKNLSNIIQEKDDLLSDKVKFQEQVCLFVDSLKDLYFMKDFQISNSSSSFTNKSNYIDFLVWLKTFLKEVHCIHESLLQNVKSPDQPNLSEAVSELVKEKNNIRDAYYSLNSEFQVIKQSLLSFPENIINIKDTLNDISSEVVKSKYSFIQDLISINKNMETLLVSYNQRYSDYDKYKYNSEKSFNELNEKYSELLCSYDNMELELKNSKILIQELTKEKDELKRETVDLGDRSNELREMISSYEMELLDYKNVCSSLEKKIIDVEREKKLIEENFKQYVSLGEYHNLKEDKNKLTEMIQNLNDLNFTLKESCGDLISCDIKSLGDDFIYLRNIIHSLLEVRKKYTTLELNYAELMSERNELLSKIESLNNSIKESVERQKTMMDEIQVLIDKDSEQTGSLYPKKVTELLMLLDYEEPTKIDDLAWTYIKDNISKYKLMVNQNMENDKFELEEKILYLESQLSDAQDFKSKFSKELHMLKPDLDISYLMSLSLVDLQNTMLIAIIEKEKDIVGDYEMKLALSTDRIQQLEEQQKRRENWLQEIEKENERLTNECKQIQDDNEVLKTDVNLKIRKIIELEHQITQQINGEQIKEYIKEREDSNHQLETVANEKNTLQLSIASLNEKLQNKSIECEDIYYSLQKKAEVIFSLEKVLSKCKTENANLEKEVQHLRESMILNLNNFNDNKQTLERDLANYKVQIEKLRQLLSDTHKKIETENKSVSTALGEDFEIELKIEGSLSNHLAKIESLNFKIDDLNSQLKEQNNKFDKEFENQAKFIESLEKELNVANELNTALKNNQSSIHNEEKEKHQSNLIEGLESEIISLRELNSLLANEKALLLKDRELVEQSRIMQEEKESFIDNLKKEIECVKNKLNKEENEKKTMQEQIDNLILKLDSIGCELTSAHESIGDLHKQNLDNKQLKEEVASLISELENCKIEISKLIKENEIKDHQLSECFSNLNLEKEINCSVKNALEQARQELLNLKTEKAQLIEEQYKDLQLKNDLCSKLNSDLCQIKEIKALQENELLCLRKELKEKVAYLEEISSNSHLEKSCPFKKEAEDIKTKHDDLNKQLEHERETFKLWKTNLEEDLHCKLLKISDLELKLKKETQCYKEALMSNSELHQKLQESVDKFKRLEDKIAIQRDVFIKEKSKSDMVVQNKEKLLIELEEKLLSVKFKCEEFSKDICMFLEKLSVMLQVDVIDLSSAITLINNVTIEKQILAKEFKKTQEEVEQLEKKLKETQENAEYFEREFKKIQKLVEKLEEELKESKEKAEQLEEECEELNNDIKYHENEIGNLYKNGKLLEEKWMKEKEELEKELLQTHELKEKISSKDQVILTLQMKIENYDKCLISFNAEKKILESEKLELERKIIDLEKSLQSLKNQEISYLDGIKREMNHLKLELVNKNKCISKLEMRLESDTLPFQKKADLAERKVEELTKELRILKQSHSFNKQMTSVLTSPMAGLEMSSPSQRNKDKIIERLEQEVKQLITEKSALKLLAQNRRVQINELKELLGKKDVHSFQD
ncbi:golgin subfamily B member 1 [Halyomorpha halys]|uniref:golgin subfamily B member 1 n=1 Tax=Halyomorpha halys TaxID=286706 RepID=UPI0034D33C57